MTTAIVEAALSCEGTPYMHQGRKRGLGLDCIGVVTSVCDLLGYKYEDFHDYSPIPDGVTLCRELAKWFDEVPDNDLLVGGVVVFNMATLPRHCGIITPYGLVHCWQEVGKCVHHVFSKKWQRRVHKVYSWRPSSFPPLVVA